LESPKLSACDPPQISTGKKDEPIYIEMQKTSPSLSKNPPKPIELSSAATKRYLQIYDHVRHPTLETRQSQVDLEDITHACCPVSESKKQKKVGVTNQVQSSYLKSFLSWMSSKAEKGTSVILDVLPTRAKED
jgi:hypothetical protein